MKKSSILLAMLMTANVWAISLGIETIDNKTYYQIGSCEDLKEFASYVNKRYTTDYVDHATSGLDKTFYQDRLSANAVLTDDIDCQGDTTFIPIAGIFVSIDDGNVFNPSVIDSVYNMYRGTFDGRGHVISNLAGRQKKEKRANLGLVGYLGEGGVVKNVIIQNPNLVSDAGTSNNDYVGGIAGLSYGTISKCTVVGNASIISSHRNAGGIVGRGFYPAVIEDCLSSVKVEVTGTENQYAGGLIGLAVDVGDKSVIIRNSVYIGSSVSCSKPKDNNCHAHEAIGGDNATIENSCYYDENVVISANGKSIVSSTGNENCEESSNLNDESTVCILNGGSWNDSQCNGGDGPWLINGTLTNQENFSTDPVGNLYFAISFNANGGEFAENAKTKKMVKEGESIDASDIGVPTRTGYKFKGWAATNDATTPLTSLGLATTTTTFYAVWEQMYKVYIGVFGNADVPMPKYYEVGDKVVLEVPPILPSYDSVTKFDNWSIESGISQILEDNVTEESYFMMPANEVYVMANFVSKTMIYYCDDNDENCSGPHYSDFNNKYTTEGSKYTREHYWQDGWAIEPGGDKVYEFNEEYEFVNNTKLYPAWKINSRTVQFKDSEGNLISSSTVECNATVSEFPNPPAKEHYAFKQWVATTVEWNEQHTSFTMIDEDVVVMAEYEPLYAFSWGIGQPVESSNPTIGSSASYTVAGEYKAGTKLVPPEFEDDDYVNGFYIEGWYTDLTDASTKWDFENDALEANTTLYAKWVKIVKTITYHYWDRNASGDIIEVTKDVEYSRDDRDGGYYSLWLTKDEDPCLEVGCFSWYWSREDAESAASGEEDKYTTFINLTGNANYKDYDIYAGELSYEITYRTGTGATSLLEQDSVEWKQYDAGYELYDAGFFIRENYTQTGWTTTDGGEKEYELGATYSANAHLTLFPFWAVSPKEIAVVYGGDPTKDSIHVIVDVLDDVDSIVIKIEAALEAKGITPTKESSATTDYTYNGEWVQNTSGEYVAQFDETAREYTVTLNVPAAVDASFDKTMDYAYSESGTTALPAANTVPLTEAALAEGFVFEGWYSDEALTSVISEIAAGTTGAQTIYGKVAKDSTFEYEVNGEKKSVTVEVFYGETAEQIIAKIVTALGDEKPTKASDDFTDYTYAGTWEVVDGKIVPKFTETAREYTVTLNVPDGATVSPSMTKYAAGTATNLPSANLDGWTFVGWVDGSGNSVTQIAADATGDKAYTAVFTKDITVVYGEGAGDKLAVEIKLDDSEAEIIAKIEDALEAAGVTPTKSPDADSTYEFNGKWDVDGNTFTAEFEGSPKYIEVVVGDDTVKVVIPDTTSGTGSADSIIVKVKVVVDSDTIMVPVIDGDILDSAAKKVLDSIPTKDDSADSTYEFAGWEPIKDSTGKPVVDENGNEIYEPVFKREVKKDSILVAAGDGRTVEVLIYVTDGNAEIQKKIIDTFNDSGIPLPQKDNENDTLYKLNEFVLNVENGIYEPIFKQVIFYPVAFVMPKDGMLLSEFDGYVYGERTVLPEACIKSDSDWEFKGWYTERDGLGTRVRMMLETDRGKKTFYPLFQKTIYYSINGINGEIEVIYTDNAEKNIVRALDRVIPEDYRKNSVNYTFDKWVLENGTYVAKFVEGQGIHSNVLANVHIEVVGHVLEVTGVVSGSKVLVYDARGRLVQSAITGAGSLHMNVQNPGRYIVRVDNWTMPVNVH